MQDARGGLKNFRRLRQCRSAGLPGDAEAIARYRVDFSGSVGIAWSGSRMIRMTHNVYYVKYRSMRQTSAVDHIQRKNKTGLVNERPPSLDQALVAAGLKTKASSSNALQPL